MAAARKQMTTPNWYQRHVLPHLIRFGCGCQMVAEMRQPIVAQAKGRVPELGMGAGANLPWIPRDRVSEVVGIEPSDVLWALTGMVRRRLTVIDRNMAKTVYVGVAAILHTLHRSELKPGHMPNKALQRTRLAAPERGRWASLIYA